MKSSPRILYVSPYAPSQASGGSEQRSRHIFYALQQIGQVELAMVDDNEANSGPVTSQGEFEAAYTYKVKARPDKTSVEKVRWLFDPRANYPHGCGVDEEATRQMLQNAEAFDLIWFFKLRTANMFPNSVWRHSVVDIDDVPSNFEQATLCEDGGVKNQLLTRSRMFSWRRRERLLAERFSVLAVCSEADRSYLTSIGVKAPIHVIPNGFDPPPTGLVRNPAAPSRIGFTGIFDYAPNVDGIRWFVDKCWPRIKQALPDARLRIAGRYSNGPLRPVGQDVEALGYVEDIDAEVATWSAMVVPILIGAGTRVKIGFGFSRQCPVISTTIGARGYEINDGEELLLADTPESFADACLKVVRQPKEAMAMAERARRKFLNKWTWEAIQPRIWAAAEDCLRYKADDSFLKTASA